MFMGQWCENCALADYEGDGCMIQLRAMMHKIGDPEYPSEWVQSDDGGPKCTAFTEDAPQQARCDMTVDMFGDKP
jgi:hypothetical protein